MMNNQPEVLVIEDEVPIRRFLRTALTNHGYQLVEAGTAQEGLARATLKLPDLIILDLGLPDRDGQDVIRELRGWTSLPILVLSARGQESDKVLALDAGADDYLTKPFGVGELLARLRVLMRHVMVGDAEIHLTPIEYKLLTTLIKYAGKVVTHGQLLKEVWGPTYAGESQYLRVYMTQLL